MNFKIFETNKNLTHNEKFLLESINQYPHKFLELNIVDFSKKFYSTKSTLSRLCKKLEFDSVLSMKLFTQHELTKKGLYKIEIGKDLKSRINNLKIYNNYAIINTIENLDLVLFEKVIHKIILARKILLFGIGSSFLACLELANNLQKINLNAFASNEMHEIILKISSFNTKDLIIVFSKEAKSKEITFLLENAKKLKINLILITANSNIKDLFLYKLLLKNIDKKERLIATCSKTSEIIIADAIFYEVYYRNKNNNKVLKKSLDLLSKWKKYSN